MSVGGPPIDALAVRERLRTAASSAELAEARLWMPQAPGSESPPLPRDLIRLLFRMRLPYMRATAPTVCQVARIEGWDPARLLTVLLAEEVHGRERSSKEHRRQAAGFPTGKTFHAWREADSPIPPETQRALRALDWVGRAENLVLVGPSGTGKSHYAEAIGHAAIDAGLRVTWFSLESLTAVITRSKVDASTHKVVERICRSELIVVDDIGQLPAGQDEAEALYRLVDAAYERRSLVLTSNLHPAAFDTFLPKGLATATVDRLLHHAHVVVTEGRSQRLEDALTGRGVVSLMEQADDDIRGRSRTSEERDTGPR